MKEELTIYVEVTDNFTVVGEHGSANMCCFGGTVKCDNFNGVILPHGVDTQKDFVEEPVKTLSARYVLEGKDKDGQDSRIFIENYCEFKRNATPEESAKVTTKPKVITNSKVLSYLETADLYGTLEPWDKGVIIHIFSR